jgi:hypothetical protein
MEILSVFLAERNLRDEMLVAVEKIDNLTSFTRKFILWKNVILSDVLFAFMLK